MTLVRIYQRPSRFGLNDAAGTRLFTGDLMECRAHARDILYCPLPRLRLRDDMVTFNDSELAILRAPLYTDHYGMPV